jgi:3-deoxy-manno-octulosonate cytidylyltransferase (CMP-KDO synthetase)
LNILGLIPARYAARRFPGKPLVDIGGQSMIERVYRQALKSASLNEVVVATDDRRIFDHVTAFGGKALMTSADHRSGTERCAEALTLLKLPFDAVINIQGDEPFISPRQVDAVAEALGRDGVSIATLYRKMPRGEAGSPHAVKVVVDTGHRALYFSRSVIPFAQRAGPGTDGVCVHVGLYGFRAATLQRLAGLAPTPLEQAESLEQLRWLEHGYAVHAFETAEVNHAVDTPGDLEKLKAVFGL